MLGTVYDDSGACLSCVLKPSSFNRHWQVSKEYGRHLPSQNLLSQNYWSYQSTKRIRHAAHAMYESYWKLASVTVARNRLRYVQVTLNFKVLRLYSPLTLWVKYLRIGASFLSLTHYRHVPSDVVTQIFFLWASRHSSPFKFSVVR